VLFLGNGDLAVLMRRPRGGPEALSAGLAPRLARLFALPEAALSRMIACWPVDGMTGAALGYVRERLGDTPRENASPGGETLDPWDCLERQVAIRLPGPQEAPRLSVLHHALRPSLGVLRRAAEGEDPFLLRYLHNKVAGALVPGLDPAALAPSLARYAGSAPVHLALDCATAAGTEAARLLRLAAERGVRLGLDLAIEDVAASPAAFTRLLGLARGAGLAVALTGITAEHLVLAEPEALGVDLLKLEASPALMAQGTRLAGLRKAVGSGRLLLAGAATEALVRWGMEQGIRRFQGAHVDFMLAAARRLACPEGAACTLAQCTDRSLGVSEAGRLGCLDLGRLDRAG
jgi:hypothetical protein